MRTTIRLDDALARAAKMRAAEQGITLTQLIDESLRERLTAREKRSAAKTVRLAVYGKGGILPGVDLADNRALRDLMDEPTAAGDAVAKRPTGSVILADVNVLVYAHRKDLPEHEPFSAWLRGEMESGRGYAVCDTSLAGFLRVVTNGRVFADPTPLDVALRFVEGLRDHPGAVHLAPGDRHWGLFTDLCAAIGARGNDVPDAYLAALAIESGSELVTADRGFGRFPGLRWSSPA